VFYESVATSSYLMGESVFFQSHVLTGPPRLEYLISSYCGILKDDSCIFHTDPWARR
jgi:hypothetical protein